MRLTSFTRYGFRMLMRMASVPEWAFLAADPGEEFGFSRNHLKKIVQRLTQDGSMLPRHGIGGDAVLARAADEIRLGELVRLLEVGQALVECFAEDGGDCSIEGCCRLKGKLHRAESAFFADLKHSALADVLLPRLQTS